MSLKAQMAGKQIVPVNSSSSQNQGCSLICKWLGLEGQTWPPDHYSLLGIPRGEVDIKVLEINVQERVRLVRCYQLSHSALATEAMNHLARAFACLCDVEKKAVYDKTLPPISECCRATYSTTTAPPPVRARKRNDDDTVTNGLITVLEWQQTTPPVRGLNEEEIPSASVSSESAPVPEAKEPPPVSTQEIPVAEIKPSPASAPTVFDSRGADPVLESARRSRHAQEGLCSRKQIYERIKITRLLRDAWRDVEHFCRYPNNQVVPSSDLATLKKGLRSIEEHIQEFPPILGVPGKPGYRVAILAMDQSPIRELQQMQLEERDALAMDWKISNTLLNTHLDFLKEKLAKRRKQPLPFRWLTQGISYCGEHQLWIALSTVAILGLLLGLLLVLE